MPDGLMRMLMPIVCSHHGLGEAKGKLSVKNRIRQLTLIIGLSLLVCSQLSHASLIEGNPYFDEKYSIAMDERLRPEFRLKAFRNVHLICTSLPDLNASNSCAKQVIDEFFSSSSIQKKSDQNEIFARARAVYSIKRSFYEGDTQSFISRSLSEENLKIIFDTRKGSIKLPITLDTVLALLDRAIATSVSAEKWPTRHWALTALTSLMGLDANATDDYVQLKIIWSIRLLLSDNDEGEFAKQLDEVFAGKLFEQFDVDQHLLSSVFTETIDADYGDSWALSNEARLEFLNLPGVKAAVGESWVRGIRSSICIRMGDQECWQEVYESAISAGDYYAAAKALESYSFEKPLDEKNNVPPHLSLMRERLVELLEPSNISHEVATALSTSLAELHTPLSIEEWKENYSVQEYLIQDYLQNLPSITRPWMGYSLPSRAELAKLAAGSVELGNHKLSDDQGEHLQFLIHDTLQRGLGSRATESRIWIDSAASDSAIDARAKMVSYSNQMYRDILRMSRMYVRALTGSDSSLGLGARVKLGNKILVALDTQISLMSAAEDDRNSVVAFSAIRNSLMEDEALLVVTKHGRFVSSMCLTSSDSAVSAKAVDERLFSTHQKLLGYALTARHPANMELDSQFPIASAQYLYNTLLGGIESCFNGKKNILYTSSDSVSKINPATLVAPLIVPSNNRIEGNLGELNWLIKNHVITWLDDPGELQLRKTNTQRNPSKTTSSAKLFLGVANPGSDANLAAVNTFRNAGSVPLSGIPSLPNAESEIRKIGQKFAPESSVLLLRETETRVKERLEEGFDFISFATHGLISKEIATLNESALLLSADKGRKNDGLLKASEIAKMKINSKFVSLSACNTASFDDQLFAEEVQGIANAFRLAGVDVMMATLWPVETNIAEDINVNVFENMARTNSDPSEALAFTVRELLSSQTPSPYHHPRFWGAFTTRGLMR